MKKQIPLAILEALQPVADSNVQLVKPVKEPNCMFLLVDKDENSDFYFKVVKQENRSGKLNYQIEFKPRSKTIVGPHSNWLALEGVLTSLKNWLALVESYNKIHTVYDDPILKSNQERFEKQFEILDDDADHSTFDLNQQLFLDEYLTITKAKITTLKEGKSEAEIAELVELEKEATEIQKDLTKESKRKVVKRLAHFWAKAQKVGLEVIKEIFVNVLAELTTKLLKG